MYNDKKITVYIAKNMTYDLNGQKEYVAQVGIERYIEEFKYWFSANITGTCK